MDNHNYWWNFAAERTRERKILVGENAYGRRVIDMTETLAHENRGRTAAATQCGSRSWAEIIRFECTPAAAVSNSVISGHPAYNGYHNGIKHNASINVNNNRAMREREEGCRVL